MILKSPLMLIKEVKKKTQAKAFKDFKAGDYFTVEMKIRNNAGASGGGCYATYLVVYNKQTGEYHSVSANQFNDIVDRAFVIAEVAYGE